MFKKNLSEYFLLGKWLWFLRDISTNKTKSQLVEWVNFVYSYCDRSWFFVSKSIMEKFFLPILQEIENIDDNSFLDVSIVQKIKTAMEKSDDVLDSESDSKFIYELYSPVAEVKKLVSEPEKFIDMFDKLDDIAKNDWKEWCKSLVYLLPTATVFYLMRIIEWLTYRYCKLFGIIQIINKSTWYVEWMWIIQRLKEKYENKKIRKNKHLYSVERVAELITIKDFFRNPTSHPSKTYTQEDASELFNRSISVINWLLKKL